MTTYTHVLTTKSGATTIGRDDTFSLVLTANPDIVSGTTVHDVAFSIIGPGGYVISVPTKTASQSANSIESEAILGSHFASTGQYYAKALINDMTIDEVSQDFEDPDLLPLTISGSAKTTAASTTGVSAVTIVIIILILAGLVLGIVFVYYIVKFLINMLNYRKLSSEEEVKRSMKAKKSEKKSEKKSK